MSWTDVKTAETTIKLLFYLLFWLLFNKQPEYYTH